MLCFIQHKSGLVNATFNNILLEEEPGVPGENHRPVASH